VVRKSKKIGCAQPRVLKKSYKWVLKERDSGQKEQENRVRTAEGAEEEF